MFPSVHFLGLTYTRCAFGRIFINNYEAVLDNALPAVTRDEILEQAPSSLFNHIEGEAEKRAAQLYTEDARELAEHKAWDRAS